MIFIGSLDSNLVKYVSKMKVDLSLKKFFAKHSCIFIFHNRHIYMHSPSSKYKTSTFSKITETRKFSNILNFNFLLCSVPKIYPPPPDEHTCKNLLYTSQSHSSVTIFIFICKCQIKLYYKYLPTMSYT